MATERYAVPVDDLELERVRLALLGATRDPHTFAALDRVGIGPGWHCLEVGAGAGTVTAWLADRVGTTGLVVATDLDLSNHAPPAANVTLLQHDIVHDPIPAAPFDLVHARAVLQHIPEREAVLDTLVAAVRAGGILVIEESDFRAFVAQPLPEPYASVHALMNSTEFTPWREPDFGTRLVSLLTERGLAAVDVVGDSWAMRPGDPGGDWWFLAVERALRSLVGAGVVDDAAAAEVRATIVDPDFVMLGPLSLTVTARRP